MHAFASALLAAAVLLAGAAARPLAAEEGWVPVGPPGGPVHSLIVHPRDPRVLWAGTLSNGVFKSVDGGASWQDRDGGATWTGLAVGDGVVTPRALAADPRDPDVLYLAGDGEVFQSSDGGQTWVLAATLPLGAQADLAVAPTGEIWVSGQEGVWSSPDGLTWTLVPGVPVTAIEVDPHPPHSAFAATPRGFYRFTKED